MPFFRFYATDRMKLAEVSERLTDRIQAAIGCPREHIVLEWIHAERVCEGRFVSDGWPYVEVSWFKRPPEVQEQVARIVSATLREAGYPDSDVYFHILDASDYYENGEKR